jgi:excisionase family DNA binding protein
MNALTVTEACDRLRISRTQFYELLKAGQITARKIGRRTVVLEADVQAFLASLPAAGGGGGR